MSQIVKAKIECNFEEFHKKLIPGDTIEIIRKAILGTEKRLIIGMCASRIILSGNLSIEAEKPGQEGLQEEGALYLIASDGVISLKITEIYRLYRV